MNKYVKKITVYAVILSMIFELSLSYLPADFFKNIYDKVKAETETEEPDPEYVEYASTVAETLQDLIDRIAADTENNASGTIVFQKDYQENITIPADVNIILDLNGKKLEPLDGGGSFVSNISVYGSLIVRNGTLDGQRCGNARGINVFGGGSVILKKATVENYTTEGNGAGVMVAERAAFTLGVDGKILNNTAQNGYGGGIYIYNAVTSAYNTNKELVTTRWVQLGQGEISENAAAYGGGICIYRADGSTEAEPMYIKKTVIKDNHADVYGGAFYAESSVAVSFSGEMSGNSTGDDENTEGTAGGACYFAQPSVLLLDQAKICENSSLYGGAIYMKNIATKNGAVLRINGGELSNNTAGLRGGAICFSDDTPNASSLASELEIKNAKLSGNISGEYGGSVYTNYKTNVTLTDTEVSENATGMYGGGMYLRSESGNNKSIITITNCTFSKNRMTASDNTRYGAGLYVYRCSTLVVKGTTFSENEDAYYGGGMYCSDYGAVTVENCIFQKNSIRSNSGSAAGGGIYFTDNSTVYIKGSTFSENGSMDYACFAGALYLGKGTQELNNCIVDGNFTYYGGGAGINSSGTLTISGTTKIINNTMNGTSNSSGGGINGSTVILKDDCLIENNVTNYRGGGVNCTTIYIQDRAMIRGNEVRSGNGGGISAGEIQMTGGVIEGNKATLASGGGMFLDSTMKNSEISGGIIRNNTAAADGGAIYLYSGNGNSNAASLPSTLTLSGTVSIYNNTAKTGGAIRVGTRSRLIVNAGATITNNTATSIGGGISVTHASIHTHADSGIYALEINGGTIKNNNAFQGRDIHINNNYDSKYQRSYIKMAAAKSMDGASTDAAWAIEVESTYITNAINNKTYIDSLEAAGDKTNYPATCYTFVDKADKVAKIGNTYYSAVQDAVNAIQSGKASGTIILLKNTYEDVTIPAGEYIIDLNGNYISGRTKSVITVESTAKLTIRDSSGDNSGQIRDGYGTKDRYNASGSTSIYGGGIFIRGDAVVTLEGGTICDNGAAFGSAVYISYGGTFIMNGGVIENNGYHTDYTNLSAAGAVCVNYYNQSANGNGTVNTNFYMNGGVIRNNRGCGVYSNADYAQIIITGGEISGNRYSNHGAGIHVERGTNSSRVTSLSISNAQIKNNSVSGAFYGGGIYVNMNDDVNNVVTIADSVISGNIADFGGGIYLNKGRMRLLGGAGVTKNIANTDGGGVYVKAARLQMYGGSIFDNNAQGYVKDVLFMSGSFFDKDESASVDYRAVSNMGISYNTWYVAELDAYYADPSLIPAETQEFDIRDFHLLFDSSNKITANIGLIAVSLPSSESAVAKIVMDDGSELYFPTLLSAITKAGSMTGVDELHVELLRDVTESIVVAGTTPISLDLKGHTVHAPMGATSVFYINGGNITLMSNTEDGEAYICPPEQGTSTSARAFYVRGGKLTIGENVTIAEFRYSGDGGAIYEAWGVTQNGTTTSSEVYIKGGTIENCSANNGGAIYVVSDNDASKAVFEMSGGEIRNCSATVYGGAIYIKSTRAADQPRFYLIGGKLRNNTADSDLSGDGVGGAFYYNGGNVTNDKDDLQIYNIEISGNTAYNGGGIYLEYAGNATNHCIIGKSGYETLIKNNTSRNSYGGMALVSVNSHMTYVEMDSVTVDYNTAKNSYAGAYLSTGWLSVKNCSFNHNEAQVEYAGVGIVGSELLVDGCEIAYNISNKGTYGGGLYLASANYNPNGDANPAQRVIKNTTIHHNTANNAGGMMLSAARDVWFEQVDIYENTARAGGAGFTFNTTHNIQKTVTFKDCKIRDNYAGSNGGAFSYAITGSMKVTFDGVQITGNSAQNYGAGQLSPYREEYSIFVEMVGDTEISYNTARTGAVGGFYLCNLSKLSIGDGVVFSDNEAVKSDCGALYIKNSQTSYTTEVNLTGVTFERNSAKRNAGALYLDSTGISPMQVTLKNCDFKSNRAAANGGAIYVSGSTSDASMVTTEGPVLSIQGTKMEGNSAGMNGGAIYQYRRVYQTVVSDDSVITGNSAGSFGGGVFVASFKSFFTLSEGGKIYGNKANLGQDVYVEYEGKYRTSNVSLIDTQSMFSGEENIVVKGWLNETTEKTTKLALEYIPATANLPITLSYSEKKNCAIYNGTIYKSVQDAIDAVCADGGQGTITLIADCYESVNILSEADIILNLNGYTLQGGATSALTVNGKVKIVDENPMLTEVTIDGATYLSKTDESGNRMTGTITGVSAVTGGGVNVTGGSAILASGQISGCQAGSNKNDAKYGGAGVYISTGSFTLTGTGKICNNTAYHSSAVLVESASSSFIMEGGEICNNKSTGNGVIYNNGGNVKIYGGTIHDNSANQGGAIFNASGKTTISGIGGSTPVISDNVGAERGGAIFVNGGSVQIGQSIIKKNRTTKPKSTTLDSKDAVSYSTGGGVYVTGGTLDIIEGALITENSAVRGGAVYQTGGTVNVMGGTITANTAQLGGGLAQNPFPGNASTLTNVSKGAVYGNVSTMTSAGNDIYSAYEGSDNYPQCLSNKNNIPKFQLLSAYNMGVSQYDVWRDDTYAKSNPFYDGTEHDGTYLGEGRYITEKITGSNIQLTADYQNVGAGSGLNTIFKISNIKIEQKSSTDSSVVSDGMTSGTGDFDDGKKGYENASTREVTAREMLTKLGTSATCYEMDETYVYNGVTYHYISYNGKKYEEHQMVEWWPGNDSNAENSLVRSFDRVTYSITSNVAITGTENRDTYTYNAWIRVKIPCAEGEASFFTQNMGLDQFIITSSIENGQEYQILEGYWQRTVDSDNKTKDISENVMIDIHGMKNGETIKPSFEMWIEGNTENEANPARCESKTLTISSAPKYNISLEYCKDNTGATFAHEGYFDVVAGTEVSKNYVGANPIVHGVILGYGVTVSLYNEPAGKKLKGLEYPDSTLEFDIDLKGEIYCEGVLISDAGTIAPYIWGYKENVKSDYGKALGESSYDRNMNWNDEDDLEEEKTTSYAYNAAPFNIGNNAKSCYNGGSWQVTGNQPSSGAKETKIHVKVSDYLFATGTGINSDYSPNQNSNGANSVIFNSNDVKPFTAGYIQVLMPLDVDESKLNGYVELNMKAVANGLDASGVSGQKPEEIDGSGLSEEKMLANLKAMNDDFYELENPYMLRGKYAGYDSLNALAVNERRYTDNISSISTSFYSYPDGGDGNLIGKYNYFLDNKKGMLSDNNGNGETPLNSYVYVNGGLTFSSTTYYTNNQEDDPTHYYRTDPLYHTDNYTALGTENNYVTAINILQKFDSRVYTPLNVPAVINKAVSTKSTTIKSEDGNDAFVLTSTDAKTSWTNEPITWSYNLTILYAAKPDGSDWVYEDVSDNTKFSVGGQPAEPGTYNDGGVRDMDQYREENLIYFETMDELNQYFGTDADGNPKGKCVAILYEVRNCCLRTGRSFEASALMKVTDDFNYTGQTYCTTNDVKTWYTYRPHYKYYYKMMKGTSLEDHTYQFNWTSVNEETANKQKQNDVIPYGLGLDAGVSYTTDSAFAYIYNETAKDDANDSVSTSRIVQYADNYEKTQYRNGSKISGTHTGADKGNSLLLYTMDTSIEIYSADYVEGSNNTVRKTTYDISNNERVAKFQVMSYMEIASAAKKTEIVDNGTLGADITIELSIPTHLSYRQGSLVYKYAEDDGTPLLGADGKPRCYYNEGDLNWGTPEIVDDYDSKGNLIGKKIILKTSVSNIDMGLPDIYFECNIGDLDDTENDINKNSSYTIKAAIGAAYEESNITAAERHESTTSIAVVLKSDIGVAKDVDKSIVEVGEDFTFKLSYSNNIDNEANIEILDVLPYNGDGRGTEFTGGYRIKKVRVRFTDAETMNRFLASTNPLRYMTNQKNSTNLTTLSTMLDTMRSQGKAIPTDSIVKNETELYVDYIIADNADMIQYAYKANGTANNSGIAFFAKYNPGGKERVYVELTLSPMVYGGTEISDLIQSGDTNVNEQTVQTGKCMYENKFVYRDGDAKAAPSNVVSVNTANRVISGVVWMDQNQNGLFDSAQIGEAYDGDENRKDSILEYPISGISATLYNATTDDDGNIILGTIATDVLGNQVKTVKTDNEGRYTFEDLREGEYVVVFSNENDDYRVVTTTTQAQHPITFQRLSVSGTEYKNLNNGNKSLATYDATDKAKLEGAMLYSTIQMPSLENIHYGPYRSNNWNLGLYYTEISVDKVWKNFRDQKVEDGTRIIYDLVGKTTIDGLPTEFYVGQIEMSYDGEQVVGHYKESISGSILKDIDIDIVTGFDEEEKTKFYWTVANNLILQAKTADGEISYSFEERGVYDRNGLEISDDFVTEIETEEDPEDGYFSFRAVNTKKEYFLSVEKVIYVDTSAHGGSANDKQQEFVFKIERFDSLENLKADENAQDTFYVNLNCTDKYVPTVTQNYVDGTVIDITKKKVTTSMGYTYSYVGYIGKNYIMVTEPGWYKVTEVTNWSATDYDYVTGSNTYLNGVSGADAYVDYNKDRSVGKYVAFSIGETYNSDLLYSQFPTARFTNVESEYAWRSAQAYSENNIKLPE